MQLLLPSIDGDLGCFDMKLKTLKRGLSTSANKPLEILPSLLDYKQKNTQAQCRDFKHRHDKDFSSAKWILDERERISRIEAKNNIPMHSDVRQWRSWRTRLEDMEAVLDIRSLLIAQAYAGTQLEHMVF